MQVQLFASLKILKTLTAVGSKLRLHRFLSHCCGQFFKLLMISFLSVLWQATAFFNWEYHATTGLKFYPCTYFSNFGWQKGLSYLLSSKRHSSSRKRLSFHNSHKLASISLTLTLIHQPHPQDKRKPYKKPNLGTETEPFTRVLVERL